MTAAAERLQHIKYVILQTTIVPSLLCDLVVFIHFIRHWRKEILDKPQNHVILSLLTVSFIQKLADIPFSLYFFRWGTVFQETYTFCVIWTWIDYTTLAVSLHLVTWCCIERHLFVFHNLLMKKRWCLVLFHYIPLTVCLLYVSLFYIAVIFFPKTCTNYWNYKSIFCGSACYGFDPFLGTYDWLFHLGLPISIILLANLSLFCRAIWQKIKRQRPVQWPRQKRMIVQLVFISMLYLILLSPEVIVGIIEALYLPTFAINIQLNYLYFISYFINQSLPFVIVSSLPAMRKDLKRWMGSVRQRLGGRVRPLPVLTATVNHGLQQSTI